MITKIIVDIFIKLLTILLFTKAAKCAIILAVNGMKRAFIEVLTS